MTGLDSETWESTKPNQPSFTQTSSPPIADNYPHFSYPDPEHTKAQPPAGLSSFGALGNIRQIELLQNSEFKPELGPQLTENREFAKNTYGGGL